MCLSKKKKSFLEKKVSSLERMKGKQGAPHRVYSQQRIYDHYQMEYGSNWS